MTERTGAVREPATPSARLQGLDTVKGLCIVGVVMIHAAPSYDDAYGIHILSGLTRLAVPTFLAVTGYLIGLKNSGRERMRSNLVTFVRLHLVYGAFYGLFSALLHGVPDPLTLKFVVMRFAESAYPGQYYLVILIQLFLFTSLLPERRSWRSPIWVLGGAVAALAGVLLLAVLPDLVRDGTLQVPAAKVLRTPNGLWLWFYYFALGARLGAAPGEPTGRTHALGLAALGLLIATVNLPDLPAWPEPLRYPYARLPIFTGATLLILTLPVLARTRGYAPIARLGRDSFGIFVLNPATLMSIEHFFGPPSSLPDSWLRVAATLVVCILITSGLRRSAPWALP